MKNHMNALLLTAALSGLVGGTAVAAQAATPGTAKATQAKVGLRYVKDTPPAKHSCKGKNSCKGTGGCSTGDQGCKGKNSCKGKGGCATDGSKPPSVV
jgi:multimeric flavodoxin WrbA